MYKRSHQQLAVKTIHEATVAGNRVTKILRHIHTANTTSIITSVKCTTEGVHQ